MQNLSNLRENYCILYIKWLLNIFISYIINTLNKKPYKGERKMKKVIVIMLVCILAIACVFGAGCGSNKPTLYVYTNAGFAPYEYINEYNEVVGVDMDIMREVGDILGYNIVVSDIEFDLILNEVQNNKMAVGAAGMTKRPDRDEVALSTISYATSVQYAIVQKGVFIEADLVGGKLPLAKLANLTKKGIGVQSGTTGHFMVDDAINSDVAEVAVLKNSGCNFTTYTNAIVASNDIGITIGAVVIDKLPAKSICMSNSNLECFELDAEPESYVIYVNKDATELCEKINDVLQLLIDNGTIDYFTIKHSGGIA